MTDVTFKAFAGIKNTDAAVRLDPSDLVAATNVDITNSGQIKVRQGYYLVFASDSHSLWSNGSICLFVEAGTLKRLHEDWTATSLVTLTSDEHISYESVNGVVYWSNGTDKGVIDASGVARSWGLPVPGLPMAANAGGVLASGTYQFVVTYLREDGQESGAGLAGNIAITTGGINFTSIPVSDDPTVTHKAIYITPQNGDILYRAAIITNATTDYLYQGGPLSLPLMTQYLVPPPAGRKVVYHLGMMHVIDANKVSLSLPLGYELFDPEDYVMFASDIVIYAPVEDGVWVGTSDGTIYWMSGDRADALKADPKAKMTSIPGTLAFVNSDLLPDLNLPDMVAAVWMTEVGIVAGFPGGVLKSLTGNRYVPPTSGDSGAAIFKRGSSNEVQYMTTTLG